MSKRKAPTKADLQRKVGELEAQLASTYHFASIYLDKAGSALKCSAVIVRLTGLGGIELTPPFAIRDGLSDETIECLRRDMLRSWELSTELKPKGATPSA